MAVGADDLLDLTVPGGAVTEAGVRANVRVALAYLDSWLRGVGAAAIDNLMEDAATAEIARSQLWLWRTRGIALADGRTVDAALYAAIRDEELARLGGAGEGRLAEAAELLDRLVLDDDFAEFLTLRAYACSTDAAAAARRLSRRPGRARRSPGAAPPDEGAVADHRPAADEHVAHRALDGQALVRRVVARVVEVGGADRPPGGRVEQDEVGVATDLDRALRARARTAAPASSRGGRPSARR